MRTVLICHRGADFDRRGLASWMLSFSDLVGIVEIDEPPERKKKRVRRELRRVGPLRMLDVLAFRVMYRLRHAAHDAAWEQQVTERLQTCYPADLSQVPVHETPSPNSKDTEAFLREIAPDLMIARCKSLLAERIFTIPDTGTFVLHPGLCPEYRNAHGGFWALANGHPEDVATTLLKIDRGVDTGPIFGHYRTTFDSAADSHIRIQQSTLLDNLPAVAEQLRAIHSGSAVPINTAGRESAEWGQPWLTAYRRWKKHARRDAASANRPQPTGEGQPCPNN